MVNKLDMSLVNLEAYLKRNNINVPDNIDLQSIFQDCDKYDKDGNEVDGGDGILQAEESDKFYSIILDIAKKATDPLIDKFRQGISNWRTETSQLKMLDEKYIRGNKEIDEESYTLRKIIALGKYDKNYDKFSNLMQKVLENYDYEMLAPNGDKIIKVDTAKNYFYDKDAIKYMDTDERGNPIDTHVLNWISNKYLYFLDKENSGSP